MEQEIKYITESEKYTMKDQQSLDDSDENYKTLDSINLYLKYEENFFENFFAESISEINKLENWEEIKANTISFIFSILSLKYKKYLKKFDNTISDIFVTLRENKDENEFQANVLFIFKNKYITAPLYVVFEDVGIVQIDDKERRENLIKSFEDLNENEEKITKYYFNPEPIVNWMENYIYEELDKNIIEKYINYYNLYIVNENQRHYIQLDLETIRIPEYRTITLIDLIDIIFLYEEKIFNPDSTIGMYGVYHFKTLKENYWDIDIINIFEEDISKFFEKKEE